MAEVSVVQRGVVAAGGQQVLVVAFFDLSGSPVRG